jgi:hypothetical protein
MHAWPRARELEGEVGGGGGGGGGLVVDLI